MRGYRAYILGLDGHVVDTMRQRQGSHQATKQLVDAHDVELWQLDRLIKTFKPRIGK